MAHAEVHRVHRTAWLRAAVLGANDGLVSMGSLLVGMGMAGAEPTALLLTGAAGLMAGTMSMAAGEYVSVASQADLEDAELAVEQAALDEHPKDELEELAEIYVGRGLTPELADEVARQLTAHDALAAHARDELELSPDTTRPLTAALSSGAAFFTGGVIPCLASLAASGAWVAPTVTLASIVGLAALGVASAQAGGAHPARPVARIVLWGSFAMATTGLVGFWLG